jgi:hypothetical protein
VAAGHDEVAQAEFAENIERGALGQYVEVATDDEGFVGSPDALDQPPERIGLLDPCRRVALSRLRSQSMHMGDSDRSLVTMIIEADTVGVPRSRVIAPIMWRIRAMNEIGCLRDDRKSSPNEGRDAEFG